MANLKSKLYWHSKTPSGWRRFPVVHKREAAKYPNGCVVKHPINGSLPTGKVTIAGVVHDYPQGNYLLRSYEGRRTIYKNLGKDGPSALAAALLEANKREIKASAVAAGMEVKDADTDETLKGAFKRLRHMKELTVRPKSVLNYDAAFDLFFECCSKRYVKDLTKDDVLLFPKFMARHGYAEGTRFMYFQKLLTFLRFVDAPKAVFPTRKELPRTEAGEVQIYTQEQIAQLWTAISDERDRLAFEFFLKTGVRKQELMFLEWRNLDFKNNVVRLFNKPEVGFELKDYERRSVPFEDDLREKLLSWRDRHKDWKFVFGAEDGNLPDPEFRRRLKAYARDAGLNCGACDGCLNHKQKHCSGWMIKTFRATFATECLRGHVDLTTLQTWLGHSNVETTMRYLAPLKQHVEMATKITGVFRKFMGTDNVIEMPARAS